MPYSSFGSQWSADEFSDALITALTNAAVLLESGANKVVCTGRSVHIPRLLVAPAADWVLEDEPLPSDAGTADTVELTPKKVANLIGLSNESIEDSSVQQLDRVSEALIVGVAKKVDAKAFSADAATAAAPAGLLNGALPGVAHAVTADAILMGEAAIQAAGGSPSSTYLNPADLAALKLTKDGQSRYLFADTPYVSRFYPTPALAAGHVVIADARFINVAVRRDAAVDFDDSYLFGNDQVAARVTMRVDFDWADTNAAYVIAPA